MKYRVICSYNKGDYYKVILEDVETNQKFEIYQYPFHEFVFSYGQIVEGFIDSKRFIES